MHLRTNAPQRTTLQCPIADGYWSAFILTPGSRTSADVVGELARSRATPTMVAVAMMTAQRLDACMEIIQLHEHVCLSCWHQHAPLICVAVRVTSDEPQALADVEALVVDVQYGTYGRRGLSTRSQQIVLPTHFPATAVDESVPLPDAERDVLPVRTHLLSHLDDPVTVVETYASRLARPGDVVALAESAVAVMQGRFRHPANVRLGWLARSACWLFFTTSSVATAPGLQVLIDCVGTVRVFLAIAWGIVCRLLGIRGGFYRVAGVQAKTIDDVSGD